MLGYVRVLATTLGLLLIFLSCFFFIRFRSRRWIYLVILKMLDNSLAPYHAMVGAVTVILGIFSGAPVAILTGTIGMVVSTQYVLRVFKPHPGFEEAFGPGWLEKIPPAWKARMLPNRWMGLISRPIDPSFEQDVPFWKVSDSDRQVLCDIWHPSPGIPPSGLGFIYLHGSAWHYSDKDHGTRPLFAHLAAQGHVVMDVAYRLCPEVNLWEMVRDVKRAIAWLKENAGQYGVDPGKVVLAGGSAGAHLALLAAYAPYDPQFTPAEIQGLDLSVKGVVSYYGPPDLCAFFNEGFGQVNIPAESEKIQRNLLGGLVEDIPDVYQFASPITHIHPGCPATLIFQGSHDMGVPVESTRIFSRKLAESGIPVVYVEFPQTDHGFDIQLRVLKLGNGSQYSPAAQAALYDLDRFLALMAGNDLGISMQTN
jgi:acetyl esterase/lipase